MYQDIERECTFKSVIWGTRLLCGGGQLLVAVARGIQRIGAFMNARKRTPSQQVKSLIPIAIT
jgi:hypothetical protein